MPRNVHGSEGHRSEHQQHDIQLNGTTNDATHDRAVGKVDGKSVIPTDTKLNVTVSVENTPEGTLLQNEVQVKVDV